MLKCQAEKSLKQRLHVSEKKALHLWSDFQRLDFSDEKVLQLWSDLLKFEADKLLKQRVDLSEKRIATVVGFAYVLGLKIFKRMVAFRREKWIATMVKYASNSR